MTLTLSSQKPAQLSPIHKLPLTGGYDPVPAIKKAIVDPLFEPLVPGGKAILLDDKGQDVSSDQVLDVLMSTMSPTVNTQAESDMKSLLQQGLVHYDQMTPMLTNELFVTQAAKEHRLPNPSAKTLYTASSDVIPAAKQLLSGNLANDGMFLASIAYTYAPDTLGFWFRTAADFDNFTTWLDGYVANLAPVLPADSLKLLTKLGQTSLTSLIESYVLRANDSDNLEEHSFARVIVRALMEYQEHLQANQPASASWVPEMGTLPFVVSELFLPRTITFVNVEAHARSSHRKVDKEWKLVVASLGAPVKIVSNKALSNLTALPRAQAKAASMAATAASNSGKQVGRSAAIVFRKTAPNKVDLLNGVMRVLKRMKTVAMSMNTFKVVKSSFARANRRDPMNFNLPGKSVTTKYLPDLHLFVDTSGSISERNYQDAVMMLIRLAKKLNVDLYFNSFSHALSQEVVLRTRDKSVAQIWAEFRRIPKIDGGTDYRQIWEYINASEQRKKRLSLVVTDFEYYPPSQRIAHPANLYYAPCSNVDWDRLVGFAKEFSKRMKHIEPAIGQRLIGVAA